MSMHSWKEAVRMVLSGSTQPMHYSEITQEILDRGLRENLGATPANTVYTTLLMMMKSGEVQRVETGTFAFGTGSEVENRDSVTGETVVSRPASENGVSVGAVVTTPDDDEVPEGIINAFGMFWRRDEVDWQPAKPQLWGMQLSGGQKIDFSSQIGIYILYQGEKIIYVGKAAEKSLMDRLRAHTRDRLTSRWDRFSWFGLRPVREDGTLGDFTSNDISAGLIVMTMEAILIEGLEPPQNRRRGDKLENNEFIQAEDSGLKEKKNREHLMGLVARLGD
ncbi:HTH domain-containing protein [Corynebacterium flavescens]|uniref:HTH domain-containing protein n=1 Tax=Corynebacterium flavescens TaxID=28028 RepID=UPI003FD5C3B4